MDLREDGRTATECRKPVLRMNPIPNCTSLQYQVNNNLVIVQLLQTKRGLVSINALECTQMHPYQCRLIQQTVQRVLQSVFDQPLEYKITIMAADKSIAAHVFNACIILLALAGFQLSCLPFACTLLVQPDMILVDDERQNCMFITDAARVHHVQASNIHPKQLNEAMGLAQNAAEQLTAYLREQIGL